MTPHPSNPTFKSSPGELLILHHLMIALIDLCCHEVSTRLSDYKLPHIVHTSNNLVTAKIRNTKWSSLIRTAVRICSKTTKFIGYH